jgi:NhaP-type Na+/H+ or K+/H+ antiporter
VLDIDGRGETASEGVMLQHSKAHATVAQRTATFACLASLAAAQCPTAPGTGDVYVGGLFDHRITDRYQFEFAASLINDKTDGFYDELLPDITMQTRILDSGCNVVTATTQMMALAQDWGQPLHGVIGARCSSASMGVAMLTRLQQIPQISARSSNPSLSDKTMYSHFYRTCAPDDRQAASLTQLVTSLGFGKVGIITTSTAYATAVADGFADEFKAQNGTAISRLALPGCYIRVSDDGEIPDAAIKDCFDEISALSIQEKPGVLLLSALTDHAAQILDYAARTRFKPRPGRGPGSRFTWIGTDGWTGYDHILASEVVQRYRPRLIGIKPATYTEEDVYTQYLARWQEKQRGDGVAEDEVDQELCPYCPETVDALVALTMALDAAWSAGSTAEEKQANIADGSLVLEHLAGVSFDGLSGPVSFDEFGNKAITECDVEAAGVRSPPEHGTGGSAPPPAPPGGSSTGGRGTGGSAPPPAPPGGGGGGRRALQLGSGGGAGLPPPPPLVWTKFAVLGESLQMRGDYAVLTELFEDGALPADSLSGCEKAEDCKGSLDESTLEETPHCFVDGGEQGEGKCVKTIEEGQCSSRPKEGDGKDHVALFNPEVTVCELKSGEYNCTTETTDEDTGASVQIENVLASKCAEFMPDDVKTGDDQTWNMCCRAEDKEMEAWALERWEQYEIQFGQCDNCLRSLQKLICQVSCDANNWRFFTGGKMTLGSEALPFTPNEEEDAGICVEYCSNVYKACRSVKWQDEVQYLFPSEEDFCTSVLRLQRGKEQKYWDGGKADISRLCTPTSKQEDTHCVGAGMHQALGFASTALCVFLVLSQFISEIFAGLPKVVARWLPSATVTLTCGFLLGVLIKEVVVPLEDEYLGTHNVLDVVKFDTNIFGFLLLPVIIFSSSFNMEHHASVFFLLYIKSIAMFAVFGTTLAILFTGGLTYLVNQELGGWELSFPESMMFGSLISAVDPVATLAAFASVGVDPRVYSLIYGESILNDAVAIVSFSVFKGVADGDAGDNAEASDVVIAALKKFFIMSIGSFVVGLAWGVLVTLLYKIYGVNPPSGTSMGVKKMSDVTAEEEDEPSSGEGDMDEKEEHKKEHRAMADAAVFFTASLSSYYVAEAIHVSGIISALLCGLVCNQFAARNMSFEARDYAHAFYIVLSELADHALMLWVGLLYYLSLETFEAKFSAVALLLVLVSRALSVLGIAQLVRCILGPVEFTSQLMMIGAGLRGAVALALVKQMPTSASDEISSATLFIIFCTYRTAPHRTQFFSLYNSDRALRFDRYSCFRQKTCMSFDLR